MHRSRALLVVVPALMVLAACSGDGGSTSGAAVTGTQGQSENSPGGGNPGGPAVAANNAGGQGPEGAGKPALYGPTDPGFTCPGGGAPVGSTFGFAVLNTNNNGTLIANVSLKGATPNKTFAVFVNQDPGDCPTGPTGSFTTNGQGNGGTQITEARVPAATHFWVSVVESPAEEPVEIYRTPAVELD